MRERRHFHECACKAKIEGPALPEGCEKPRNARSGNAARLCGRNCDVFKGVCTNLNCGQNKFEFFITKKYIFNPINATHETEHMQRPPRVPIQVFTWPQWQYGASCQFSSRSISNFCFAGSGWWHVPCPCVCVSVSVLYSLQQSVAVLRPCGQGTHFNSFCVRTRCTGAHFKRFSVAFCWRFSRKPSK